MKRFLLAALPMLTPLIAMGANFDLAAKTTNEFGIDLYRKLQGSDGNLCLSPYSISCALAMTLAGADGLTRTEMARVLHANAESDALDDSFAALRVSLEEMTAATAKRASQVKRGGGSTEPITLAIANRLFPQAGFEFRPGFFPRLKEKYGAEPEPLNFKEEAEAATRRINEWVEEQTRERITNLIPKELDSMTRLVLANAIYLKAPWANEFSAEATKPEPFHVGGGTAVEVPMMQEQQRLRYAKRADFSAVALPYSGGQLQFLVLLPEKVDGLGSLEGKLSGAMLAECTTMPETDVIVHLPKFKFEPPTVQLSEALKELGMKTAFDVPAGSANFDRMAPRKPDSYLAISEVFHKTFIALDEKGTEAAAATAVVVMELTSAVRVPDEPIEVRVDRPFLYAIQHVPSGTCLFLGRVTDPR